MQRRRPTGRHAQLIVDFALQQRIPSSYDEKVFVEFGGLLSYAPSFTDLFARAAIFVDKILKGAKPGELPIQQPTTFELAINAKTARALGLTIPQSMPQPGQDLPGQAQPGQRQPGQEQQDERPDDQNPGGRRARAEDEPGQRDERGESDDTGSQRK